MNFKLSQDYIIMLILSNFYNILDTHIFYKVGISCASCMRLASHKQVGPTCVRPTYLWEISLMPSSACKIFPMSWCLTSCCGLLPSMSLLLFMGQDSKKHVLVALSLYEKFSLFPSSSANNMYCFYIII